MSIWDILLYGTVTLNIDKITDKDDYTFDVNCTLSLTQSSTEAYMDVSNGHRRRGHRSSSHRTSFIEYVSEVYNTGRATGGNLMEALSIRGHSISSAGSGASGGSSAPPPATSSRELARDFSVRSETASHHSNRVLGGPSRRHTTRNKSSRIIGELYRVLTIQLPLIVPVKAQLRRPIFLKLFHMRVAFLPALKRDIILERSRCS